MTRSQPFSPCARRSDDRGFTLIEVMVVVLVIGILLAIGIPTYLGARSRAQDQAARSTVRASQVTALVIYTDDGSFAPATPLNLSAAEPAFVWRDANTPSSDQDEVSSSLLADGSEWGGATSSDSGSCFYIRLRASGSTLYGSSDSAPCTGAQALTVTDTEW